MIPRGGDSRVAYLHIYIREGIALRIYYKPIIAHISNASYGEAMYRQDDNTDKKQHVQAADKLELPGRLDHFRTLLSAKELN